MPSVFDAATIHGTTAANSASFSHPVGSGSNRLLEIYIAREGGTAGNIIDVTFDGVSLTERAEVTNTDGSQAKWYMVAPPSGAFTIVVTQDVGDTFDMQISAVSYQDVDQAAPYGTGATNSGTSTNPTVDIASAVTELVVAGMALGTGTGSRTPGSGQTSRTDGATGTIAGDVANSVSEEVGAASVTMDYTTDNDDWSMIADTLKPAAAPIDVTIGVAASGSVSGLAAAALTGVASLAASLVDAVAGELNAAAAAAFGGAAGTTLGAENVLEVTTSFNGAPALVSLGGSNIDVIADIAASAAAASSVQRGISVSLSLLALSDIAAQRQAVHEALITVAGQLQEAALADSNLGAGAGFSASALAVAAANAVRNAALGLDAQALDTPLAELFLSVEVAAGLMAQASSAGVSIAEVMATLPAVGAADAAGFVALELAIAAASTLVLIAAPERLIDVGVPLSMASSLAASAERLLNAVTELNGTAFATESVTQDFQLLLSMDVATGHDVLGIFDVDAVCQLGAAAYTTSVPAALVEGLVSAALAQGVLTAAGFVYAAGCVIDVASAIVVAPGEIAIPILAPDGRTYRLGVRLGSLSVSSGDRTITPTASPRSTKIH